MSYTPVDLVEVRAWDRTVGAVALDPASGFYAFEYDTPWAAGDIELDPLGMRNSPDVYTFASLSPLTFQRLPPLLADALPDRFGNALVDAWMAEQGVAADRITALDRLAYTADRGMGALTFRPPADRAPATGSALALADLVTAARATVRGHLDEAPGDALRQLIQVGTSAGGARAKAVVAYHPGTGQLRSGQLDAPPGYEHWLVKLDGVSGDPTRDEDPLGPGAPFGRIEYAYALMAGAAGIEMTECRLLPEGPRTHFLTRRFDRGPGNERLHALTLCAMARLDFNLANTHSYSQYFQVIDRLGLGAEAREQAFRRMVFNVAAVNRDDHTKNLSFLLPHNGSWRLAPAYDLTHAHNPVGEWTQRHQMAVNGRFDGIGLADLREVGDRHLVPGYDRALREVLDAVDRWPDFASAAGVPGVDVDRIGADLARYRPR